MNLRHTLTHAVTAWDIKQSTRKGYNRYALAIYLGRVDEVVTEVETGADLHRALRGAFNDRLLDCLLLAVAAPKG